MAKCLVDNLKGVLPFNEQIRRAKHRLLPYKPNSSSKDAWTIQQGLRQIGLLREDVRDATIFEIGSGWQPMIPLLFSMAGARRVLMTDLHRLCCESSFRVGLARLRENANAIRDALGISDHDFELATSYPLEASKGERGAPGRFLDKVFEMKRLEYLAPCDARKTGLPAGSIDLVISRAVFEHVRTDLIQPIFEECFRILRPGGRMCHMIDNSDHWEHGDKSITRVNFLKFSDAAHRAMTVNPLAYVNRVRHSEYRMTMESVGFQIVHDEPKIDQRSLEALKAGLRVAPRFRGFTDEDLAASSSTFVARRP